ncbi:hypothetical protein BDR06DRAFT_1015739 [Suillus hirtellus]|nr:hypothetical protein BDR06DRAFT_1015739 [Suillus hirtellus]
MNIKSALCSRSVPSTIFLNNNDTDFSQLVLFSVIQIFHSDDGFTFSDIEPVIEAAQRVKENGTTRFCMGAAWRDLAGRRGGFELILQIVLELKEVKTQHEHTACRIGLYAESQGIIENNFLDPVFRDKLT